ncbi:MAG: class II SORL domain-containing protein [Candidatus Jettenia sp. CY-1]|nr:class II SORL domain-containing protein [Candidatus Jettenia sp.]WKZ19525.1 MAG: class II SORL domain-containing protein [Candidatus Jettenia sp. CY-1]
MAETGFFCQVNNPTSGPADKAKTHAPVITVQGDIKAGQPFTVGIKVGEISHPMENGHFIQFVDLYSGDIYLSRIDFTAELNKPEVSFSVVLYHEGKRMLRAFSRCNLHGIWEGTKEVNVTK